MAAPRPRQAKNPVTSQTFVESNSNHRDCELTELSESESWQIPINTLKLSSTHSTANLPLFKVERFCKAEA